MFLARLLPWSCIPSLVQSLASTDSISDADPAQSGYLPDHNMDPAVIDSTTFGILWRNTYDAKERWYAKPLVYTPPGQPQLVFTASSQNWIRTVDAVTGTPIKSRQVQPPFLQSDIGCTDIPDTIGITGTPVIDSYTNTVYFFAKGYRDGAANGGVVNGVYQFYAVDILDLSNRPGFPVLIDGHYADNDPKRYFIGGTVLQRPSLTLIHGFVFGAFASHCEKFNYTGMVVGVSTSPGVGVTSLFATESSPGAPKTDDIMDENGGEAGIWMGGMAPATDGSRIFVTTGNGQGQENKDNPSSGRLPLSTLDEALVNLDVSSSGKLSLRDYFEPYEYSGMDTGDRDLGSGGVSLLDPSVFYGINGVSRLAVTVGRNGKAYICNADNLGGFKQGSGGTDDIIQTIVSPNPVFGGPGSYPLEGGYLYFTPIGSPTLVYSFKRDERGLPLFSKAGESSDKSAGRAGAGIPTITSFQGQPGTGVVWVTDVDAGLKAYKAVPVDGKLVKTNLPPIGGLNSFQRPVFGDGRLYVTDNNGRLICLGSPVSLSLNCSSPVDFGDLAIGSTATVTVNCTALVDIAHIDGATVSDPTYQVSNASLPQGFLKSGDDFSFPLTWDLSNADFQDTQDASLELISPLLKNGSLTIFTGDVGVQDSKIVPISIIGNQITESPLLSTSPTEVDFGGLVKEGPVAASGLDSSFVITNEGTASLEISGYAYSEDPDNLSGLNNVTFDAKSKIGAFFTSTNLPAIGSVVLPGKSVTVSINFNSDEIGNHQNILQIWSNGGIKKILMTGSVSTTPVTELSVETSRYGWEASGNMNFGDVVSGTTQTRRVRICNAGGSGLLITKSQSPNQAELHPQHPTSDLREGQIIPAGFCAFGPVDIAAAPQPLNVPDHTVSGTWTLDTDDLNFGVHDVNIKAKIVSRKVGPRKPDGTPIYSYLGCYSDGTGRQLERQFNLGDGNENGACQTQCLANGYKFAGTEYHSECWCGNIPPTNVKRFPESAQKCTFGCANDTTQACGGDGAYISIYYDSTRYTPDCDAVHCGDLASPPSILTIPTLSTSDAPSATPSIIPYLPVTNRGNSDYTYLDCYKDIKTKAIDPFVKFADETMTVAICLAHCQQLGSKYAGVEYRQECYCGGALATTAVKGATGCSLTCYANATEYCGGSSRMNVYKAV